MPTRLPATWDREVRAGGLIGLCALIVAIFVLTGLLAQSIGAGEGINDELTALLRPLKGTTTQIAPMTKKGDPTAGKFTDVKDGKIFDSIFERAGITPCETDPADLKGHDGFLEYIGKGKSEVLNKAGSRSTFGYFIKVQQEHFNSDGGSTAVEREYFVLFSYDLIKVKNKNGVEETICATEFFLFQGGVYDNHDLRKDPYPAKGFAIGRDGRLLKEVPLELARVGNFLGKDRLEESVKPGTTSPGEGCIACHDIGSDQFPNETTPFPWMPQPPKPEKTSANPFQDDSGQAGRTDARPPSALEGAVLAEVNAARTDPQGYAAKLRGPGAAEAIAFLDHQPALPPLAFDSRLAGAAQSHAADQGPQGLTSHTGTDGSTPSQRMQHAGVWSSVFAEEISLGQNTAEGVVRQLVIDEQSPSRSHRKDLFGGLFKIAGVGCGPHKLLHSMCVIDLTAAPMVTPRAPPPPPPPPPPP